MNKLQLIDIIRHKLSLSIITCQLIAVSATLSDVNKPDNKS